MTERITQFIKKNKLAVLLFVGIIVGLILVTSGEKEYTQEADATSIYTENEYYLNLLEEKLEEIINEIEGVSNAKVVITLESGAESVFATDGDGQEDKHVITGDGLVCVKKLAPSVEGVAVVCKGGDKAVIKEKITSLISSLLGLYSNHIYVTE